jgi:glc operon protein GlcG
MLKNILSFSFIFIVFVGSVRAQDAYPILDFSTAKEIMDGSVIYAKNNNLSMAIAIYDTHGQLIHFIKMDGTSLGVSKVAQWKGLSAAVYQFSTEDTGKWNVPNAPEIATVPGGLPIITKEGNVIGGIGVSGAAASVDVLCAEAGLRAAGLFGFKKK